MQSNILKMLQDYFPDMVDFVEINYRETTEFEWPPENHIAPNVVDGGDPHIEELVLKELEPETGVFAAMSPFTHRVFVCVHEIP